MPLPNEALLIGAARWLYELRDGNEQHAFEVLKAAPQYSGLTPTQYMNALEWLRGNHLLEDKAIRDLPPSQQSLTILEAALVEGNPLWLTDSDQIITNADELPEDVEAASRQLGLTAAQCLQVIRNVHSRIDLEARARLGAAGELALMRLLRESGDGTATHVAATSDSLGFDIFWAGRRETFVLEVKSTSRRGRLTIHLSRNEFEVSRHEPRWRLVILLINGDDAIGAIATLSTEWLHAHAPQDRMRQAKWENAAFAPPPDALAAGIPITPTPGATGAELLRAGTTDTRTTPSWWPSGNQ
jgi:hypothetical protein